MKNLVIIGGSYVGMMVAQELIKLLDPSRASEYRVIVVEKNSHFSHLFAYPRFAILPSHEHKTFLPFPTMLPSPHLIRSSTTAFSIDPASRTIQLESSGNSEEMKYEVLVLAMGTNLSPPGTIPGQGTKKEGVEFLKRSQRELGNARKIVILGGGAIGVQMACDLATLYPPSTSGKRITLLHSREQLMPRFHPLLSNTVKMRFEELGIETILGSRAVIPEGGFSVLREGEEVEVKTEDGRSITADCIIQSTGQTPNSKLLQSFAPSAIAKNGFIEVNSSLHVVPGDEKQKMGLGERVFAIGDIANSGAPKAARPAMIHSQVLARNILEFLTSSSPTYESIELTPSAIHLTLGFVESVIFRNPPRNGRGEWEGEPTVVWKDDGEEDMGIEGVWERRLLGWRERRKEERDYHL